MQEITRSGAQIMAAIEEIRKGAQVQSAATEESAAAVSETPNCPSSAMPTMK